MGDRSGQLVEDLTPQEAMRRADPFGDRIHLGLAMLAGLVVGSNTAPCEFAFAALFVCWVVRLTKIWNWGGRIFGQGLARMLTVWSVFAVLSLVWSVNPGQGGEELLRIRFVLLPLLVYPVADRAKPIITSFLLGVAAIHVVQFMQYVGLFSSFVDAGRHNMERFRGLNHPVASGNLICMAACIYVAGLLAPGERGGRTIARRVVCGVGLAVSAVGLLATGSRGPWIAAACVIPLEGVVLAARHRTARRGLVIGAIVVVVVGALSWPWLGSTVRDRVALGYSEVRNVLDAGDYASHTGARILMMRTAVVLAAEHPIIGVGGGSYKDEAVVVAERFIDASADAGQLIHNHAHNLWLHEAATRGVIGVVLAAGVFVMGIRAAWQRGRRNWMVDGVGWSVLVLAACGMFDHPMITQNCSFALMLLLSVCMTDRRKAEFGGGGYDARVDSDVSRDEGRSACG
jgi:O-antigen ligase